MTYPELYAITAIRVCLVGAGGERKSEDRRDFFSSLKVFGWEGEK